MRILKTLALYVALGPLLVTEQEGSMGLGNGRTLIDRVKQTLASQLDSKLPNVAVEEWLLNQVGTDATVASALRTGAGHSLPWVEADISVKGRPGIVILVANAMPVRGLGSTPTFKSLQLVRKGGSAEWPHLHDLPAAMKKARGEN